MIDRALRDGYEVHRAALAHGFHVTLLPRQVMEVRSPDGEIKTAFSHGVPQQTTLAAVTYAQDVRMRRDMVMRAGFTVPTGATFSMGRSSARALHYAEQKLGFPVVIKPAVGDNTIDVISGIKNAEELERAIEFFHTPPAERPGYTRAAYALTELREPGVSDDGRIIVPPGYRFLVEKQIAGEYLRFLVLGGEVLNVLHCPDGPWQSGAESITDVTDQVHDSLKNIAVGVTAAIPGIALAAVDVVVKDHRSQAALEETHVVEYSERPWLEVQHSADPDMAEHLADQILAYGFGTKLPDSQESIAVNFLIDGSVHPAELLAALKSQFEGLGLEGDAEVSDPAMGHITGDITGDPASIAWLMETIISKGINGQRAMLVEARQFTRIGADIFQPRG